MLMGGREIYNKTFVYKDGSITARPLKDQEPLIYYYYEENDSIRFLKKGAQREICIELSISASIETIKEVTEKSCLDERIKEIIYEMLENKKRVLKKEF